jgi:hypothetical protein
MDAGGGPVVQSPATEDETIARKRSRRVSFADTTAVHVFPRDEDFETPPEERPASPSPPPGKPRTHLAAEGDETEGEEEFVRAPFGFLGDVDLGSASPASAAGSFSSFDGGSLLLRLLIYVSVCKLVVVGDQTTSSQADLKEVSCVMEGAS